MTIPTFTLKLAGGLATLSGATETPLKGKVLVFTSNVREQDILNIDGALRKVLSRRVALDEDGKLNGDAGIDLLANDASLGLENSLEWQVSIEGMRTARWAFTAPAAGATVDLATVAPVAGAVATGVIRGPEGPPGAGLYELTQPDGMLCTLPRYQQNGATVASGELNLTYFQAPVDDTYEHLALAGHATAAVDLTMAKVGIYSVDGSWNLTRIGSTDNETDILGTPYLTYPMDLLAPVSLTRGGIYAVGQLIKAATPPSLVGAYVVPDANLEPRLCGLLTDQDDLPETITDAAVSYNYRAFYTRLY